MSSFEHYVVKGIKKGKRRKPPEKKEQTPVNIVPKPIILKYRGG